MSTWCIFCGKYFTPLEFVKLSAKDKLQRVYSLRHKLLHRTDKVLRTYVIHKTQAELLLARGNGFQKGTRFSPARLRLIPAEYGVLNGKIYVDDLPHCRECGGQMLTDGHINRLLKIRPAERRPIDRLTQQKVLERSRHKCARCGSRENLEIHHIRPVVHGGTNELENLVVLCRHCHLRHSGEFSEHIWPDLEQVFLDSEPVDKADQ